MPRFEASEAGSGPLVRGFAGGGFLVGAERYKALLMTPERAIGWQAPAIDQLTVEHLSEVLALDPVPEFVLLGSGLTLKRPPRPLAQALEQRRIGLEVMDSRAAARTWAVLRAEERWIVAALMPLA